MIKNKICPRCGSTNCEESINAPKKVLKFLYPERTKKIHCYLCYTCGASETTYELKGGKR